MVCIYCGASTQVINSRLQRRANHIWRRRKCVGCGEIFTTEEHAALHSSLMVETRDRQLIPFNRDRLFTSVHDSCRHRASSIDDASALTHTIVANLVRKQRDGLLQPGDVAQAVHQVLTRFDHTAAAVYAAYHPTVAQPEGPATNDGGR